MGRNLPDLASFNAKSPQSRQDPKMVCSQNGFFVKRCIFGGCWVVVCAPDGQLTGSVQVGRDVERRLELLQGALEMVIPGLERTVV